MPAGNGMHLVNARAGLSTIHGRGLIAHEFLPAGTLIWRFEPDFDRQFSADQLARLPAAVREQVQYYACYDAERRIFFLSIEDDRFTNHSNTPNTTSRGDYFSTYASVDIQVGEEITSDYREIGVFGFEQEGAVWAEPQPTCR